MKETKGNRIALEDGLEEVNGGNILIGAVRGNLKTRLSNLLHTGGKSKATTLPSTVDDVVLSTLECTSDNIDKRTLLQSREADDQHTYTL